MERKMEIFFFLMEIFVHVGKISVWKFLTKFANKNLKLSSRQGVYNTGMVAAID